jgi:CubicO group peptidase (beta-lactamase class C family)
VRAIALAALTAAAAVGPVPDGVAGQGAGIDSIFQDLAAPGTPGCAVGVVRDGALAFTGGYGTANLDHDVPITPRTVFYTGSVSKQFTAAAVALAAWQGHLALDDDIRMHVPELPDYGTPISVRQLVHHTSGLRDYLTLHALAGIQPGASDEAILRLLVRQRALNFQPGERYLYSNTGYFLLSEIVRRATGLSLREFARREFFDPLGMDRSLFLDDATEIVPHRATGYSPTEDGYRMDHWWPFAQVGSGGLYSTVEDLARWAAALGAGGVGPAGFVDALVERGVLVDGETLDYAFGLTLGEHRGLRTVGHGGALAGFRSHLVLFPDQAAAVVVLCNRSDGDPGRRAVAVAEQVLGDSMTPAAPRPLGAPAPADPDAPEPTPASADRLRLFEGRYYAPELEVHYTVRATPDGLAVTGNAGRTLHLRHVGDDTFRGNGLTLQFRVEDHLATEFVVDAGRVTGVVFERAPEPGGCRP